MEYPQRKLHRLKSWDYSQNGYYHVTICTKGKRNLFCRIRQTGLQAQVIPTAIGKLILEHWEKLDKIYPNVKTDYFCLMPNHVHGIIVIEEPQQQTAVSLSQIMRGFKSVTTRAYNQIVPETERNKLWQPSYYDEIIRDDAMLYNVRNYIMGNPSKWVEDELYVE